MKHLNLHSRNHNSLGREQYIRERESKTCVTEYQPGVRLSTMLMKNLNTTQFIVHTYIARSQPPRRQLLVGQFVLRLAARSCGWSTHDTQPQ